MHIFNFKLEPSAATRRDWRHLKEAWREFVADWREEPLISIICLAGIVFFIIAPWIL